MTKKSNLPTLLLSLFLALAMGFAPACSSSGASSQDAPTQEQTQQQAAEEPQKKGVLSLAVSVEGWESSNQGVPVAVTGASKDGQKVEQQVVVTPGQTKALELSAGSYDFAVDGSKISTQTTVYKSATVHESFGGEKDATVSISVSQDAQATQELARKAEEEAAAKAEAEAKAKAEAEEAARAQAEAEAAAQAQAQAEAQRRAEAAAAAQPNEQTVYITKTGKKYHRDGCRYLKKSQIPISLSDAESRGYTPCSKCF